MPSTEVATPHPADPSAPERGAGRHAAAPVSPAAPARLAPPEPLSRLRVLPPHLSALDPWTLLLGGAVLLAAAFTLVPALFPQPRVPTVTRAALPTVTSPAPTTPEAPVYPTTSSVTPLISGRVNLNSASLEQLEALPKVGPALASRIVAGRPYRSLADLDRVKVVGSAALKALGPLVSF